MSEYTDEQQKAIYKQISSWLSEHEQELDDAKYQADYSGSPDDKVARSFIAATKDRMGVLRKLQKQLHQKDVWTGITVDHYTKQRITQTLKLNK